MKNLITTIILILTVTVSAYTQDAIPVDEFGKITIEDLMARLDGLRNQLYANEGSIALLRVYRGDKDNLGFPSRSLARMKTYLTNNKVGEKKIVVQECDGTLETQNKLYLVPASTAVPLCTNTLTIPKVTTLFDSYLLSHENDEIDNCCSIEGSAASAAIATLQTFASLLQKSPTSRAYVVAYNGTNVWYNDRAVRPLDRPSLATKTALTAKTFLSENGIDPNRVVAINGGYRDSNQNVELWIVPEGGTKPKPTPNYFPKKRKKVTKR